MRIFYLVFAAVLLASCASSPSLRVTRPVPPPSPLFSLDVPIYATSLVGTPYRWGGGTPGEGFDCSGLVGHVYAQVGGLTLPRRSVEMSRVGHALERLDLAPGDLVFFNTQGAPNSHVGIYVGEGRFVHAASARSGILLSRLDAPYWRSRYDGARRLAEPAR
jgi:cell wall-associated NlpC family hydrolase